MLWGGGEEPCRTVSYALKCSREGDTILLEEGKYAGPMLQMPVPVHMRGVPHATIGGGANVTFKSGNASFDNLTFTVGALEGVSTLSGVVICRMAQPLCRGSRKVCWHSDHATSGIQLQEACRSIKWTAATSNSILARAMRARTAGSPPGTGKS